MSSPSTLPSVSLYSIKPCEKMAYNIPHLCILYSTIGRKEIMFFFYLYGLTTIFEFLVLSGIIATATSIYPVSLYSHFTKNESLGL